MTDTIDRLDVLDLDDDVRERPVVTRRPLHPPPPPFLPLSATVRYPPGRVPDVQDAVPAARETVRGPRRWRWRWLTASPVPGHREAVRVPWRWPQLTRSRVATEPTAPHRQVQQALGEAPDAHDDRGQAEREEPADDGDREHREPSSPVAEVEAVQAETAEEDPEQTGGDA